MAIVEDALFYTNYFAYIAESGLNRARYLFPGIQLSLLADPLTIANANNAVVSRSHLSRAFITSYEYLWVEGHDESPVSDAVLGLSNYILQSTGLNMDEFLTSRTITVSLLYARLSEVSGIPISDGNIG